MVCGIYTTVTMTLNAVQVSKLGYGNNTSRILLFDIDIKKANKNITKVQRFITKGINN